MGKYIFNILVSIDQLGNVFAGGTPDNTISARVGYFAYEGETSFRWYWKLMEFIIDITFLPVDGPSHCKHAYFSDTGEEFKQGNFIVMLILTVIIIATTIPICFALYLLYILTIVSPRNIDKVVLVKDRLISTKRIFKGIRSLIDDYPDEDYSSTISLSDESVDEAKETNTRLK